LVIIPHPYKVGNRRQITCNEQNFISACGLFRIAERLDGLARKIPNGKLHVSRFRNFVKDGRVYAERIRSIPFQENIQSLHRVSDANFDGRGRFGVGALQFLHDLILQHLRIDKWIAIQIFVLTAAPENRSNRLEQGTVKQSLDNKKSGVSKPKLRNCRFSTSRTKYSCFNSRTEFDVAGCRTAMFREENAPTSGMLFPSGTINGVTDTISSLTCASALKEMIATAGDESWLNQTPFPKTNFAQDKAHSRADRAENFPLEH
jgi:hypothetical protein